MPAACLGRSVRRTRVDARRSQPAPVGKLHVTDLVRAGVAGDDEPAAAAAAVVPELPVQARGIVAQIDVVDERARGVGRIRVGTAYRAVTQIGELLVAARTAEGAGNTHAKLSMLVRLGARALFVDQRAAGVAIEPQRRA